MYIIIRGPLGIGKTTISKILTKKLNAEYVSIDEIVDGHGLNNHKDKDGGISEESFLMANEIFINELCTKFSKGKTIVIDGNFYRKSQIKDLISKHSGKVFVFTLDAPIETCISRDSQRKRVYGPQAAIDVYRMVKQFDYGIKIKSDNATEDEIVNKILSFINKKSHRSRAPGYF